jgi:hypothetical protein
MATAPQYADPLFYRERQENRSLSHITRVRASQPIKRGAVEANNGSLKENASNADDGTILVRTESPISAGIT